MKSCSGFNGSVGVGNCTSIRDYERLNQLGEGSESSCLHEWV